MQIKIISQNLVYIYYLLNYANMQMKIEKWIIIKINNLLVIKNDLAPKIFTNFIDFSLRVQIID